MLLQTDVPVSVGFLIVTTVIRKSLHRSMSFNENYVATHIKFLRSLCLTFWKNMSSHCIHPQISTYNLFCPNFEELKYSVEFLENFVSYGQDLYSFVAFLTDEQENPVSSEGISWISLKTAKVSTNLFTVLFLLM